MQEEVLLEMLEIACGLLNENEICTYCKANLYGDCHPDSCDEYCSGNIFDGLEIEAKKRIRKQKQKAESEQQCA